MTSREQEIFLRGIAVGMRAAAEFETGLEKRENVEKRVSVPRVKKVRSKGKRTPWTEAEKDIMRNSPDLSVKELAELIPNHKMNSISAMRYSMGLKREKKEEVDNGLAKLNQ